MRKLIVLGTIGLFLFSCGGAKGHKEYGTDYQVVQSEIQIQENNKQLHELR